VAQFVVRQLEEDVAEKLRRRARRNARSMEDEVRHILRAAVRQPTEGPHKLGSRISGRFRSTGLTEELPELRGTPARPADLDR
jgi:plasmid stability protein